MNKQLKNIPYKTLLLTIKSENNTINANQQKKIYQCLHFYSFVRLIKH